MKRILILYGGCSSEHTVSLQSARAVLDNLNKSRWEALPVFITPSGQWTWEGRPCTLRLDRGHAALVPLDGAGQAVGFDAAFPVLHGKNGEDGTVQGIFELAGVPIIGCGALSSALCMDKDRAHRLAASAGVPVPRGRAFPRDIPPAELAREAAALGYPLFVKPVRAGSSFGISRITQASQLAAAAAAALRHDREILLEEAVPGFEVGCAVLGNPPALTVGEVDEIELRSGFFDFDEKYTLETAAIHCPARIPAAKAREIREAARTVYTALDCRGFARVDFFLTPEGRVVFNEVNTIPGLTVHSRYPNMMRQAGLDFPALLDRLIELGVGQ